MVALPHNRNRRLGLLMVLVPLAMLGMLPFAAHIGIEKLLRRDLGWKDIVLPGIALLIALPGLLYLSAGSDAVGSRPALPALSTYVTFIMLEIGVYLFALWLARDTLRFGKATAGLVVAVLLVVPFIQVGQSVDFVMRASIPALAILSLMIADLFIRRIPDNTDWRVARAWAMVAFAVGLATPISEAGRAILWEHAPRQLCGYYGVVPNGYATYVAPLDRLPALVRPHGAFSVTPHEPSHCWDRPWRDAITGGYE